MSHFTTLVILPNDTPPEVLADDDELQIRLSALLDRYDENREVPEYETACWCVGRAAKNRAHEKARAEVGPAPGDLLDRDQDQLAAWEQRYDGVVNRELAADPEANTPDPNCEECHGTGIEKTTQNKESKWDWWVIGGRWAGKLGEYHPEADPTNYAPCEFCEGTGSRAGSKGIVLHADGSIGNVGDPVPELVPPAAAPASSERAPNVQRLLAGRQAEPADVKRETSGVPFPVKGTGCNACYGTGMRLKWSSQWTVPRDGNLRPVKDLDPNWAPFALVTPDGEWHQQADMGWWGITTNNRFEDDWQAEFHEQIARYSDGWAVLVDCHV